MQAAAAHQIRLRRRKLPRRCTRKQRFRRVCMSSGRERETEASKEAVSWGNSANIVHIQALQRNYMRVSCVLKSVFPGVSS